MTEGETLQESYEARGYQVDGVAHGMNLPYAFVDGLAPANSDISMPGPPLVASDGSGFLLATIRQTEVPSGIPLTKIIAAFGNADGKLVREVDVTTPQYALNGGRPYDVAYDGTNYLLVYSAATGSSMPNPLLGTRISPTRTVRDGAAGFEIDEGTADVAVVAYGGNDCGQCGNICVVLNGTAGCEKNPPNDPSCTPLDTQCVVAACDPDWVDLDGQYGTGCEYACTPTKGGVEVCGDGLDNDCDGLLDGADDLSGDMAIGVQCFGDPDGICSQSANAGVTACVNGQVTCTGANVKVENLSSNDCCYYAYGYGYDTGDSAASFSLHSGYRFGPHVAVELGYLDAGNPKWDEQFAYVEDLNDFYDNDGELDLQSAQLSALGLLPFAGIWEAYLKLGAAYWWADAEQRLVSTFDGSVVQRSVDDESLDVLVGIGVGVRVGPSWRLRLEYQTFGIEKELLNASTDSTLDTPSAASAVGTASSAVGPSHTCRSSATATRFWRACASRG